MNVSRINVVNSDSMTYKSPLTQPNEAKGFTLKEVVDRTKTTETGQDAQAQAIGKNEVKKVVEGLQSAMDDLQTSLDFSISEDSKHQIIVTVVNQETDEVIKQFPPEELVTLSQKMQELTGILFNKEA